MANHVAPIEDPALLMKMDARGRMPGDPGYDVSTSRGAQLGADPLVAAVTGPRVSMPANLVPQAAAQPVMLAPPQPTGVPLVDEPVVNPNTTPRHVVPPSVAFLPGAEYGPIVGAQSGGQVTTNPFLRLMSRGEGNGNYETVYGGIPVAGRPSVPVTQMTAQQAADWSGDARRRYHVDAAPLGAYQIVGSTMQSLINQGVVRPNEMLAPDVQDRLAIALGRQTGGNPAAIKSTWVSKVGDSNASLVQAYRDGVLGFQPQAGGYAGAAPLSPQHGLSIGMAAAVNAGNGIGPIQDLVRPGPELSPGMAAATNAYTKPDLSTLFTGTPVGPKAAKPVVPQEIADPTTKLPPWSPSGAGDGPAGGPQKQAQGYGGGADFSGGLSLTPFRNPDINPGGDPLGAVAQALAQHAQALHEQRLAGAQAVVRGQVAPSPVFIA